VHPRRSWLERLRPAALVVTAVLVLGSFVGLIAYNVRDQDGGQDEAASGAADTAAAEDSGGGEAAPEAPAEQPAVSVGGTPRTVAQALRRDGFDARVAGGRVIVRGASAEAVEESLADRGTGPVEVFVRP
jgi:hypothetical protein